MNRIDIDLFGTPILRPANIAPTVRVRKIGYAARLATGPKRQRCGTCIHASRVVHLGELSHKCARMVHVWSYHPETDISLRAPACSEWSRKPWVKNQA